MKHIVLLLVVFASSQLWGQREIMRLESGPDLGFLYERVTRSDFVVVGTVSSVEVISKKGLRERINREEQAGAKVISSKNTDMFAGWLVTIEFEKTLCRQKDFSITPAGEPATQKAYVFYPDRELGQDSELRQGLRVPTELFSEGRRYLVYLYRRGGEEEHKRLVTEYELDPSLTYYRAFEGDRGAREFPSAELTAGGVRDFVTPAAALVEQFCQAVKPPDVATKLAQLKSLRYTAPADLRLSVEKAIQALEAGAAK